MILSKLTLATTTIVLAATATPAEKPLVTLDELLDAAGFSEEDREKIFLPFVSRKDQGTGLGLALTRKVIVHHGGRISATRSDWGGACFRIALPLRGEH